MHCIENSRKVNKVSHGKIKEVKKLKEEGFAGIKVKNWGSRPLPLLIKVIEKQLAVAEAKTTMIGKEPGANNCFLYHIFKASIYRLIRESL